MSGTLKREREMVRELVVMRSFRELLAFVPEEKHAKFTYKFGRFLYEEVCDEKLWSLDGTLENLRNDTINFYFFDAAPKNKSDLKSHFVGIADADYGQISTLCSVGGGFGRRIFEWLDRHFEYPELWQIEALPGAVGFWLKMGFEFDGDDDSADGKRLLQFALKYNSDDVGEWLSLAPDNLSDFLGTETYYDVREIMEIQRKYASRSGVYNMYRSPPKTAQKNTMLRYLRHDNE